MFKSSFCDYSDVYILVKGTITVTRVLAPGEPGNECKEVVFKNCVTAAGGRKDVEIVLPLKYLSNFGELLKCL